MSKFTQEMKDQVLSAVNAGMKINDAAKQFGMSANTINNWKRGGAAKRKKRVVAKPAAVHSSAPSEADQIANLTRQLSEHKALVSHLTLKLARLNQI